MAGVNTVISTTFNNKGIKQAESALDGFGKKVGPAIAGVAASLAAIGAGMAIRGLVDFTRQSIDAATDLTESVNAVNVAFGDSAEAVLAIGENAAESLGVSQNEFNNAAVRFSAFAERVVGEGGNVAEFIGDISQRATDFASVFNIDVSEALQVFQSGLAGEAEPLKRFGINLLQTEVAAYAVEAGITASGEAMTEAQKVQARYGLLMEETNKTAGDFANTSDSLANRQRILRASMEDLRAEVGTALLPAMESFAGIAQEDLMPVLADLGESLAPVVADVMERIAQVVKDEVIPAVEDFGDWITSAEGQKAIDDFGDSLQNVVTGFLNVKGAIEDLMNSPLFGALIDRLIFMRDTFTIVGWTSAFVNGLEDVDEGAAGTGAALDGLDGHLGGVKAEAFATADALMRFNALAATAVNTGSLAGILEASAGEGMAGGQVGWDAEEYLKNLGLGASSSQQEQAAKKLARNREQLLDQVAQLGDAFSRVTGVSDTELGKFEENVNKTFESVTDIIDKALSDEVINQRVAGQLGKIAKSARITALGIARDREIIAQEYEKLLEKLDAAKAVRESTRNQIAALANLGQLSESTKEVINDLGEVEEVTTVSSKNIVNNLESVLSQTRKFAERLAELRAMGLDPRLFQQIVDSGVEAGGQTAEAIIEGGPEAVQEINSLFDEINKVGDEIGVQTAEVMYDGGEKAIEGLLAGLREQDEQLAEQADQVANIMMSALSDGISGRELDVNSIIRQLKDMRDDFRLMGMSLGDALMEGLKEALEEIEEENNLSEQFLSTPVTSYEVPGGGSGVAVPVEGGPGTIGELPQAEQDFLADWLGSDFGNEVEMALGGIVTKPTRALMGEHGQEAVIPLSTYDRMMRGGKNSGGGNTFIINVQASNRTGGSQAGEEVVAALKAYNSTNGSFNNALTGFGS